MGPSLTLFVALFLGFASMTQSDKNSKCEGKITPNFKLLNAEISKDYEERKYEPSAWICTKMKQVTTVAAAAIAANSRLTDFKQATYTDEEMECETWPVLISAKEISKDKEEYEMCWLVPPQMNAASLKPSNDVEVKNVPELTVFVRHFGGYPSIDLGKDNAKFLKEDLFKAGESYDDSIYYGAGYEPYFKVPHHNEIWVPKKNQ